MVAHINGAGDTISRILSQFPTTPTVADEVMIENIFSAMSRKGLHPFTVFKPHDRVISIAGGGPSLSDTMENLTGEIVTMQGAQRYLLDHGIRPYAVGVLDANEHIADQIEADPKSFYFVASNCHPAVFDKLQNAGCDIILYHAGGLPGISQLLPKDTIIVGGGSTIGLRWINLAYLMGYRTIHLHGLDSNFRGGKSHAYNDYSAYINFGEYRTKLDFLQQVEDFRQIRSDFENHGVTFHIHGEGLLQDVARNMRECS